MCAETLLKHEAEMLKQNVDQKTEGRAHVLTSVCIYKFSPIAREFLPSYLCLHIKGKTR